MKISHNKFWELSIDKYMDKQGLRLVIEISTTMTAKFSKVKVPPQIFC